MAGEAWAFVWFALPFRVTVAKGRKRDKWWRSGHSRSRRSKACNCVVSHAIQYAELASKLRVPGRPSLDLGPLMASRPASPTTTRNSARVRTVDSATSLGSGPRLTKLDLRLSMVIVKSTTLPVSSPHRSFASSRNSVYHSQELNTDFSYTSESQPLASVPRLTTGGRTNRSTPLHHAISWIPFRSEGRLPKAAALLAISKIATITFTDSSSESCYDPRKSSGRSRTLKAPTLPI